MGANCSLLGYDNSPGRQQRTEITKLSTEQPSSWKCPKCECNSAQFFANEWHCYNFECREVITDKEWIQFEEDMQTRIRDLDILELDLKDGEEFTEHNETQKSEALHRRGVTAKFLLDFTNKYDCWDWTTTQVVRDVVKKHTAEMRCRYTEFLELEKDPEVPSGKGAVGQSGIFVSHCWGAKWGNLVAAVTDGLTSDEQLYQRRVWVDIFAVRQWPGSGADLEFKGVLKRCDAVILSSTSLPKEFADAYVGDAMSGSMQVPREIRVSLAFYRVWCLVELWAALESGVNLVMKIGKATEEVLDSDLNIRAFVPDEELLNLYLIVDVRHAEATFEQDRLRILKMVEDGIGTDALNSLARQALSGAMNACKGFAEVGNAACGDLKALDVFTKDQQRAQDASGAFHAAASAGYTDVTQYILGNPTSFGVQVDDVNDNGVTALHLAARAGNMPLCKFLIDSGADMDKLDNVGRSAMMFANGANAPDIVKMMLDRGADPSLELSGLMMQALPM